MGLRLKLWVSGFGDPDLKFERLEFWVLNTKFWVCGYCLKFRVFSFENWALGFGVCDLCLGFIIVGLRLWV